MSRDYGLYKVAGLIRDVPTDVQEFLADVLSDYAENNGQLQFDPRYSRLLVYLGLEKTKKA